MPQILGKLPRTQDLDRDIFLADLRCTAPVKIPAAPPVVDYSEIPGGWPMLLNDQLGDCVIAAMMHLIQLWAWKTGRPIPQPTDGEIVAAYGAIGGYDPSDPSTDQGCDPLAALKYWKSTGITVAGQVHTIGGYAVVDTSDPEEVRFALEAFGGLFTGWNMPVCAQNATSWAMPRNTRGKNAPGSWGGHMTVEVADTQDANHLTSTWGQNMVVVPPFFPTYVEFQGCWVIIPAPGQDWMTIDGKCPAGFDLAALTAYQSAL